MFVYVSEVVQVVPMKDYTVYVYFEDGKIVCYDMKNMLDKEVFKPLKDISVFIWYMYSYEWYISMGYRWK